MNKAIVVIGGGAGGMMAAICAARKGAHVTLLDPNERLRSEEHTSELQSPR